MIIFGIIGWKDVGKTYFAQKIISSLSSKKIRVASIKHAHHDFDIDLPQTDSFLHRKAGSQQVIISSSKRWAKISELNENEEKKLDDLINELDDPEVVIVEGYKNEKHPKIEIIKDSLDNSTFMFKELKNVSAIVSDINISSFYKKQFKKNQIDEIVEYILTYEK
jgi:molybdopterin-guanine dinucleotide biosynthesis protein B